MGVSGQHHAPASLYPRGKDPRYPLYRRLGGLQSRSGHRGYRKNPLPPPGIEPRSPGRPARSQTLYCLSYPGSHTKIWASLKRISISFNWNTKYDTPLVVYDFLLKHKIYLMWNTSARCEQFNNWIAQHKTLYRAAYSSRAAVDAPTLQHK
jgi:hypothetical protein